MCVCMCMYTYMNAYNMHIYTIHPSMHAYKVFQGMHTYYKTSPLGTSTHTHVYTQKHS